MRLDHNAKLERLLARHSDIAHVPGASGNGTLLRRDQLLVSADDADGVHDYARRWVERRDDDAIAGFAVLHLRPSAKVDVCELTTGLWSDTGHRRISASPNHVLMAAPGWIPGPFDDPTPAGAAPALPPPAAGAQPATVAVLDTGIAAHPWFDGAAWFAACGDDVRETPDADADTVLDSVAGHGTFIAGVVLQQAPAATLVVERIIDGDGVTDEARLLRGLARLRARAHAGRQRIDVLSLSLGCYTHDDRPSPVVARAFNAIGPETVVVACAGNAASDRPFWPAALKRVIAVGSLDESGTDRAPFSNYGWWVDACTSGDRVVSSYFTFTGPTADGPREFDGYATWSGTSFAAPRLAGAIAAGVATGLSAPDAAAQLLEAPGRRYLPDLGVMVDVAAATGAP
jgi:hypothetical protein